MPQLKPAPFLLRATLSYYARYASVIRTLYIIYKPHPDVLVGNRKGNIPTELIAELADYQALDADIIQCIPARR